MERAIPIRSYSIFLGAALAVGVLMPLIAAAVALAAGSR